MNVLITGGAGHLGRLLAAELLSRGHAVTLFDRIAPADGPMPWQTNLPFVKGSLTSLEDCLRAIEAAKADAICHLGGIPWATDHPRTIAGHRKAGRTLLPEDETFRVNTLGTYYILDAARRRGVNTVAMATSFFVLGLGFRISETPWLPRYLPIDEDHPLAPEDSYSLSKMLDEEILAAFTRAWGLRTVALRLMPVYYEWRPDAGALLRVKVPTEPSPRPPFNGWLYVDGHDAAQAFRLAVEATDLEPHERFFIASDRTTVESPRGIVLRLYPELREMAEPLGPDDFLISIERARHRLGYEPRYSWRAEASAEGTVDPRHEAGRGES